jgi:hypothetical protein
MKDISVEYCHIYTNSEIEREHEHSVELLKEIEQEFTSKGKTVSLVVMVDDYSFPDPSFSYEKLFAWLSEKRAIPHMQIRESQLIPLCDEVIGLIKDEKLKFELIEYIRSKKYPCSLFIATWYLLRLGHLKSPIFDKNESAKTLLNVLPESFKPYEEKGVEIIKATRHKNSVENIRYEFIPGRDI